MSSEGLQQDFGLSNGLPPVTYLLEFRSGATQKSLANSVEKELIANGAQVHLVSDLLELSMGWLNLIRIMQGFMAFGLVVGIAGLAVVATRSVHQRKHDIGTMRALGFRRTMVLSYLLAESSFISLLGILLGVATGILMGYGLYVSYVKDDIGGPFVLPVPEIVMIASTVFIAGLIFTFLPAFRAASMRPAEALRPKE